MSRPFGALEWLRRKVPDNSVANEDLATMAQSTIKGRAAGAGTGSPQDLTATQVRTLLSLVIGTDVQAWDADLSAIAGLTSAANKLIRFTGSGAADLIDFAVSTWTPTITGTVNLDSTTPQIGPYVRIGNIAIGTISVDADASAAASTTTTFEFSLAVASNFSSSAQLCGGGVIATNPQVPVEILASSANDTGIVTWKSNATTSARVRALVMWQII